MFLLTNAHLTAIMFLECMEKNQGKPVNLQSIAELTGRSISSMEGMAYKMKKAKLIQPVQGPGGGYVLARPLDEIMLDRLVVALDVMERKKLLTKTKAARNAENTLKAAASMLSIADVISEGRRCN